ncbi:MAG: hypothetical protein M1309_01000 [Actinobacteria bacterium]|nr:hypothetical protein [Actinomycetota bacterium]
MAEKSKKDKDKKQVRRNPFAGRPRSGAGFHDTTKYGKKNRRGKKDEIEQGVQEEEESGSA